MPAFSTVRSVIDDWQTGHMGGVTMLAADAHEKHTTWPQLTFVGPVSSLALLNGVSHAGHASNIGTLKDVLLPWPGLQGAARGDAMEGSLNLPLTTGLTNTRVPPDSQRVLCWTLSHQTGTPCSLMKCARRHICIPSNLTEQAQSRTQHETLTP